MTGFDYQQDQQTSMKDVHEVLSKLRPARNSNPPVFVINQMKQVTAKNGGYPIFLYHERLDPVQALTEDQASELKGFGYVETYIPKSYPKYIFRRNFEDKFKLQKEDGTNNIINHEYVETRLIRDAKHEVEVRAEKRRSSHGPWCDSIADIEPMPDGVDEPDPVKIARLEATVVAMEKQRAQVSEAITTKVDKRTREYKESLAVASE
jgi:hypothetical protein